MCTLEKILIGLGGFGALGIAVASALMAMSVYG